MIIVTGATGKLGRGIVERLARRVPADRIGVSVRDPAGAADLAEAGVRVRRGDFTDPPSLDRAFEGADQLLIVSSNARAGGGDPLAQHRAAIDAARTAGARRIVYTSHMAAGADSAFSPMHDHAATEAMLANCGVPWTALRHGFYADSGLMLMGDALRSGAVEAPADGPVAWTAHADLAEAAAIVLADEGRYDGPTPPLTGGEALDLADLAALASRVLGRPVERRVAPDEAWQAAMTARGMPEGAIRTLLGLYAASRAGEFAPADPELGQLLDRSPITMRTLIEERVRAQAA